MVLDNKNIKALDGLRGYSIILVLFSHWGLGNIFPGGLGVTIFFFVSGFLICKLLLFELNMTGKIKFKEFYLRRIFRLYPALIFFILNVVVLAVVLHKKILIQEILASLFYYMNYNIVFFRSNMIETFNGVYNILWSLSIEEHFYLLFPFILSIINKKSNRFVALSIFVVLGCLAFRIYNGLTLDTAGEIHEYNYRLTHTRLDSIMFGCIIAYLLYYMEGLSDQVYVYLNSIPILLFSILIIFFTLLYRQPFFRETFRYTIQGIALCSIVPFIVFSKHKVLNFIFMNKGIVFIGRLSYSLYLFHWVTVYMFGHVAHRFTITWLLWVVPSGILLALVSYYLIEKPFVGLRKKFGSNV